MSDKKITDLPEAVSVLTTDLLEVATDPAGTPTSKKATVAVLRAAMVPVALTADVTGTLPVANGGTAQTALVTAVAALAIDWSLSPTYTKTLGTGGNTFTFSNQTEGQIITVRLTSSGGGSTVTWPTVKWPDGTVPTQTSTGIDIYTFFYDGTDTFCTAVQAFA